MVGKEHVGVKMWVAIRVEKFFEGTDVTTSSNFPRTCIQNGFFYGFSRFDKVA